jgi:hypothetical protein
MSYQVITELTVLLCEHEPKMATDDVMSLADADRCRFCQLQAVEDCISVLGTLLLLLLE